MCRNEGLEPTDELKLCRVFFVFFLPKILIFRMILWLALLAALDSWQGVPLDCRFMTSEIFSFFPDVTHRHRAPVKGLEKLELFGRAPCQRRAAKETSWDAVASAYHCVVLKHTPAHFSFLSETPPSLCGLDEPERGFFTGYVTGCTRLGRRRKSQNSSLCWYCTWNGYFLLDSQLEDSVEFA